MKLSVVISTFNRANELKQTLELLSASEGELIEYVVRDNGSTDNTNEILQGFRNDSRFKISKSDENVGLDENLHQAIKTATGEYIWLLSDDDLTTTNSLQVIFGILNKTAADYFFICFNEVSGTSPSYKAYESYVPFLEDNRLTNSFLSSNILKRDLWHKNKPLEFNGTAFDYLYVIYKAIFSGASIVAIEGSGLTQNETTIIESRGRYGVEYFEKAFFSVAEYLLHDSVPDFARQILRAEVRKSILWFFFSSKRESLLNFNQSWFITMKNRKYFGWWPLETIVDFTLLLAPPLLLQITSRVVKQVTRA